MLARWHRQRGEDTWLLTGTDEHGQKVLRTAVANGTTPKAWADELVETAWKPLLKTVDIRNDDFIRTTDPRHEQGVQRFLQTLYDAGHIYPGEYEGYYCVGCEEYKQLDDLVESDDGEYAGQLVCRIHSRPVEILKEKNYFFRMSAFEQRLLDLYRSPTRLRAARRACATRSCSSSSRASTTSRSRARASTGACKVPWDDSHVVYVWFDALLNYITAIGYGDDEEKFERRWPAMHLVGKDIARFHAVIWPAMLMAAGLEVPRTVFGHGWLLVGGEKMSKSKLTGIAPEQITDTFGSDAFRYYFLSRDHASARTARSAGRTSSARYHAELANGFGNLASRVIAMVIALLRRRRAGRRRARRGRSSRRRAPGGGCRERRDRPVRHPRGARRRLGARRRAQPLHHRDRSRGRSPRTSQACAARDGARDRGARPRHPRRAAVPGDAEGDRAAVGGARRDRRSGRRSTSTAPGDWTGSTRVRALDRRSSRASRPGRPTAVQLPARARTRAAGTRPRATPRCPSP